MSALAALISERRVALGKTYRDLAADSGLSIQGVWKLANVDRATLLPRDVADKLSAALGVPSEVLVGASLADLGLGPVCDVQDWMAMAIAIQTVALPEHDQEIVMAVLRGMSDSRGDAQ